MVSIKERGVKDVFLFFFLFFVINPITSFTESSTNYTIQKSVVDQGGCVSTSTNYQVIDAVGQPCPVGASASTEYGETSGFLGGGGAVTDVDEEATQTIPKEFKLLQNYPNPFNPVTTITFDVKEPCRVVLKIYDLMGREMAILVDSPHQPGQYKASFQAAGFASGVYLYSIRMGGFTAVRKMVLME
jgi:hypothetical protein